MKPQNRSFRDTPINKGVTEINTHAGSFEESKFLNHALHNTECILTLILIRDESGHKWILCGGRITACSSRMSLVIQIHELEGK